MEMETETGMVEMEIEMQMEMETEIGMVEMEYGVEGA